MKPLARTALMTLCLAGPAALAARAAPPAPPSGSGIVDGSEFHDLLDDTQDIVEVDLDSAVLQAMAKKNDDQGELLAKLKSIHAVIGTVKGPASDALALVRKTDQKLTGSGWKRITRISAESSTVSVLTHTAGDKIDGLVALIFDRDDKELVFASLAGDIDLSKLEDIGDQLNLPGLGQIPGAH